MKVLIAGATGFVGTHLVLHGMNLPENELLLLTRDHNKIPDNMKHLSWLISDINSLTPEDLQGVDVVINAAAKTYSAKATESEYELNNIRGTQHLAECAASAGVRRFIFISTVKVHGEYTMPDCPFRSSDQPNPNDAYARSKLAAEQNLQRVCAGSKMDFVIIRPPLIYGGIITGNLRLIEKLIRKKVPMPFASIRNERSLLSAYNLADAVWRMLTLESISGKILLLSDGITASTADIVRYVGRKIGISPVLLPVPDSILKLGCRLLGRKDIYIRTCMSLHVEDNDARELLGWSPPFAPLK